ncbi:four-carbon acid sugar kinase family protein [Halomonas sp. V046]|uniref:four-carbon acid sugar kinase family protein n=1 Tax=Halomonas sp. V046 TaxID=3459611 RepID=UPI004044C737
MSDLLPMSDLLLSYYGDDLTGSTDALEALESRGVPSVLFTRLPTAAQRARFQDRRALGLAGTSRSESNAWMQRELTHALTWLKAQGAPLSHYKTCSTFDSAPDTGSIGCALEIGREVFARASVPIVVGVPQMRRYTVFGELYAAYRGDIYRIDRHPVMARHPVTPMREADLRRHLAAQTSLTVGLIDPPTLAADDVDERVTQCLADHPAVLFDVLDSAHQAEVGRQLWRTRPQGGGLIVGSSGVEYALLGEWQRQGIIGEAPSFSPVAPVERIAVVSGSVSSTTERQIRWAEAHGFVRLALDAERLLDDASRETLLEDVREQAQTALAKGHSVIVHTALGPASHQATLASEKARHTIGKTLGELLGELIRDHALSRACVAGGDTSSHAIAALNIHALTVRQPLPDTPGSPLCTAYSDDPAFDGLNIAFKGGQIGEDDFFGRIRHGQALPT